MSVASLLWSYVPEHVKQTVSHVEKETGAWMSRNVAPLFNKKEEVRKPDEKRKVATVPVWSEAQYGKPVIDGVPRDLYSLIGRNLTSTDLYFSFLSAKPIFKERKQLFMGNNAAMTTLVRRFNGDLSKLIKNENVSLNLAEQLVSSIRKLFAPQPQPLFTRSELKDICKTITALDLKNIHVTVEMMRQIVEFFPNLETLDLASKKLHRETGQSDAVLEEITKLTKLKTLKLAAEFRTTTATGVAHIAKMTQLEVLHFIDSPRDRLIQLKTLTNLRSLLVYCEDAQLELVGYLPHLEELYLPECRSITQAGIKTVAEKAKKLRVLDLTECNEVDDAAMAHLVGLPGLQKLVLRMCKKITDAGTVHLGSLSELKYLNLYGCRLLTNATLKIVGQLTSIEHLDISGLHEVTDEGIELISHFKNPKVLRFGNLYKITDRALTIVSRYTSLEVLDIRWCKEITDQGLGVLLPLTRLRKLLLHACVKITGEGLRQLLPLQGLTYLDLHNCPGISDDCLKVVSEFSNLKTLILTYCKQLTAKGFMHLQTLRQLEKLDLTFCNGVDDTTVEMCSRLPRLRELSLYACKKVTSSGLKHLLRCETLRHLTACYIRGYTDWIKYLLKTGNPKLHVFYLSE